MVAGALLVQVALVAVEVLLGFGYELGYLIWHLSQYRTLEPGDVVNTGTPEGVALSGRFPYLAAGNVMELEIDGLGRQRVVVHRRDVGSHRLEQRRIGTGRQEHPGRPHHPGFGSRLHPVPGPVQRADGAVLADPNPGACHRGAKAIAVGPSLRTRRPPLRR